MATRSLPLNSIVLTVPAVEWELAVSIGAIEDPRTGLLYAPQSAELTAFQSWLPSSTTSTSTEIALAEPAGISLTNLMARCTAAINAAFPEPVWVRIEISQIRSSSGNLYVQAIERSKEDGREMAKATAQIWRSNVTRIGRKFSDATGMELAAGIQVLVLVKPNITGQYGLGLQIIDIDPSYTLGDLQARLKRIRDEIAAKGFGDNNRRLPAPDDFFRVGVVSPEGAAGLEDFQAVANLLEQVGLCTFAYFPATFQGDRAKESIRQAMIAAHQAHETDHFDALVIIRGGGAAADLHWLDEYVLAAMVCRFHAPVFTGIGHERDKSILDEYAHRSFGTPSKVIGYIRETIGRKAAAGYENWQTIAQTAAARLDTAEAKSSLRLSEINGGVEKKLDRGDHAAATLLESGKTAAAARLQRAESHAASLSREVVASAQSNLVLAGKNIDYSFDNVAERAGAALDSANRMAAHNFSSITLAARRSIDGIDEHLEEQLQSILGSARSGVNKADEDCARDMSDVALFTRRTLSDAEAGSRDLMEGILAHGVGPTLKRGFAMVKNAYGPVSTKAAAETSDTLEIVFRDGSMTTKGTLNG